jgi:peptide/nickel transport system substrate-binding protein
MVQLGFWEGSRLMHGHTRVFIAATSSLMVLLAACGNNPSTGSSAAGKTLVIDHAYAWDFSKDNDPSRGGVDFEADPFFHAVYDSLLTFKLGDSSTPVPLVAQSYTVSPDAKTFTFTIRKDVKFADGTPLNARDVEFTYNRLLNLHDNPVYLLDGITSMKATDDYTFVLVSSVANPAIPFIVTNPALGIINSKLLMAHGGSAAKDAATADTAKDFLSTQSVGSGPYVMSSVGTSQVVLKANSKYWGSNKSNFGTIIFRNVAAATQQIEIQKASNQIELSLSGDQAASLKSNSALNVSSFTSPNITFAFCNIKTYAACANEHFVNAIRYGIDYQGLISVAGAGAAQAPGVVPSQFLGALPLSQAVKRDVTKAKSELQASGVTNPTIDLDYTISSTGLNDSLAAKIKANLAEVGITVNLNGQPSSIATPNYRGAKYRLGLAGWAPDFPDPNNYQAFLPGQLVGKRAGWLAGAAPDIEALGAKAGATPDNATRGQLYQQLQTLLNQKSPMLPLIQPGQSVVATKNLTNVIYSPVWYLDFASIGTS